MRLVYLVKGPPGHPLHPPLTDATIGAYTVSTLFGVIGAVGWFVPETATAWWLALVVGLALTFAAVFTGLVDWFDLAWGSAPWKTATRHMAVMLAAWGLFGLAALLGYGGFAEGRVPLEALVLTLAGFGTLTVGGWLGGTMVFVHGMRVLREQGTGREGPAGKGRVPGAERRR